MNSNARSAPRTRSSITRRVIGLIVAVVMALGLVVPGSAAAAGAGQSVGLSANPLLGPLSAKWWQWALSQPSATNPLTDESGSQCRNRQSGPVFFLAGWSGEPKSITRTCEVERGKTLFLPLVNAVNFKTLPGETTEDLWNQLQNASDFRVDSVFARVNGTDLPGLSVNNALYRGCAGPERGCFPRSFALQLPQGNLVGLPPGVYRPAVADGLYAVIPPLPRGEHVIEFGGSGNLGGPFTVDVTYHLTVS